MAECYTCKSLTGEKRISPGPAIYSGNYWVLEHAYPCKMKGWLVLVLKRHAEALHELSQAEFLEMAEIQARAVKVLHKALDTDREYMACFHEKEHFNHVHLHLVARAKNLSDEYKGTKIFAMLNPAEGQAVPPEEIANFCRELKNVF